MMTKKAMLPLLMVTSLIFMTAMLYKVEAQTVENISKSLICPCGCGKILAGCYCDTANEMQSEIERKISEGKTKGQIIADFQADYGDQVLATTPKTGLELTLWMFPILASVIGTVTIYQLARKRTSIPDSEVKAPIAETVEDEKEKTLETEEEETRKYEEIFEQEYQKFKENQE